MVLGHQGGWRGWGRVRRRFFNEFSLIFIEFSLIFIDFLWFWEAGEAGEAGGVWRRFFNEFSLIFIQISIDFH